jgi:hypothetical protein
VKKDPGRSDYAFQPGQIERMQQHVGSGYFLYYTQDKETVNPFATAGNGPARARISPACRMYNTKEGLRKTPGPTGAVAFGSPFAYRWLQGFDRDASADAVEKVVDAEFAQALEKAREIPDFEVPHYTIEFSATLEQRLGELRSRTEPTVKPPDRGPRGPEIDRGGGMEL